jgi:hypothetical protein
MKKLLFIIGIVLFIFLVVSTSSIDLVNAENETNETEDEEPTDEATTVVYEPITLYLDGDRFLENTALDGTVTLHVDDKISSDEEFKLTIGTEEYVYEVSELLSLLNITIEEEPGPMNISNSATTKTLTFGVAGEQYVGLDLPRYATVNTFEFIVTGEEYLSSYPTNVTIDIGDEGSEDWYYFGDFQNFVDYNFTSLDLDGSAESVALVSDNNTYFCELINIPETKEVEITGQYEKLGSVGNLTAVVFSAPGGNPLLPGGRVGGNDLCDLPDDELGGSCEVSFDYPISGEMLFCLYNNEDDDGVEDFFELPIDTTTQSTTSFACPTSDSGLCTSSSYNFFISVKTAYYDKAMQGATVFGDWETFYSSVIEAARFYNGGTDYYAGVCNTDDCSVPIKVSSDTSGIVTLSDLVLDYREYDSDVDIRTEAFYDLEISPNLIAEIDSHRLIYGTDFDISLEELNISLAAGDYDLKVEFMDNNESTSIQVLTADEFYTPSELISEANEMYTTFLTTTNEENKVVAMLGYETSVSDAKDKIGDYELQVGFVSDVELIENIETQIGDLPWSVEFSNEYNDIQIVEPDDISSTIGEDDVYFMQDDATVSDTRKKVTITTYNGEVNEYYLVKKTVLIGVSSDNYEIYVVTTGSISSIMASEQPVTASTYLGKYDIGAVSSGTTNEYYFLTDLNGGLDDFTMVVKYWDEEVDDAECSVDDDCNSGYECVLEECVEVGSNMLMFLGIGVLAIGIVALFYFMFFKKDVKVVNPIVEHVDSEIMKFIKAGKKKGMTDEAIRKVLIKKGWKRSEIDSEFSGLIGEKSASEISSFIKEARKKGIGNEAITKVLMNRGWSEAEIRNELRRH